MKLQPNFSWQKYEGQPEDQRTQFQFQLQNQHIQVANSVNATIDDESFFNRERMTSFTWTDGRAIWKQTVTGTIIVGGGDNPAPMKVNGAINTLVEITGSFQNTTPLAGFAFPIPYLDALGFSNSVGVYLNDSSSPPTINVRAGDSAWLGYTFNVTIYYTKV